MLRVTSRTTLISNQNKSKFSCPWKCGPRKINNCFRAEPVNTLQAKTGPLQFVAIPTRDVISLLRCFLRIGGKIFAIPYRHYHGIIKQAAAKFRLHVKSSTRSARMGGALHDFCNGMSSETITATGVGPPPKNFTITYRMEERGSWAFQCQMRLVQRWQHSEKGFNLLLRHAMILEVTACQRLQFVESNITKLMRRNTV